MLRDNIFGPEEQNRCVKRFYENERLFQSRKGEIIGYKTGWPIFDKSLDGLQNGLWVVGGLSNVGKTMFLLNLLWKLRINNPDTLFLFFTIDDSFAKCQARLGALISRLYINIFGAPNKGNKTSCEQQKVEDKREKANSQLIDAFEKNLIIRDSVDGKTLDYIKNESLELKARHENIVVFLDNFHKVRVNKFSGNQKWIYLSEEIKSLSNLLDCPLITTAELRKLNHNGRPELDDIKDATDLVYDADCTLLLHNDYHSCKGETEIKRTVISFGVEYDFPIIDVRVAKNKFSDFKSSLYYDFTPSTCTYQECTEDRTSTYRAVMNAKDMKNKRKWG